MAPRGPAVLVHGGAGRHSRRGREEKAADLRAAAEAGWRILATGGAALDAVEAATRVLEACARFDAGAGSYLNRDGEVEVDAIVADGARLDFGAVLAVPRVLHAVSLARRVLEDSPHAMLAGAGAERFARERGLCVPAAALVTPANLARWRRHRDDEALARAPGEPSDTVGAVAIDAAGHAAAATSTGGTPGKWPGRVGDSPIPGSGAWADDRGGAVSCTGHGEAILRAGLAFEAGLRLRSGAAARDAAEAALAEMRARIGSGEGGLIVVDRGGGLGWAFHTRDMPFAWRSAQGEGQGGFGPADEAPAAEERP